MSISTIQMSMSRFIISAERNACVVSAYLQSMNLSQSYVKD